MQYVNDRQVFADDKLTALSSGEEIDIHGTMITMKEAELSLRLATTMRDKLLKHTIRLLIFRFKWYISNALRQHIYSVVIL